jgi:hypothetical protein
LAAEPPSARVLLRNPDGTVRLEGEARLVAICDGKHLEHVVRRVTAFAFAVSSIVATLALTRVAPRPMGLFAVGWVAAAIVARVWVARRRREHGVFTVDFEAAVVRGAARSGPMEWPLDGQVTAELTDPDDPSDHARWLLLRRGAAVLRLAYAPPADLRPVLYVLRKHGVSAPVV